MAPICQSVPTNQLMFLLTSQTGIFQQIIQRRRSVLIVLLAPMDLIDRETQSGCVSIGRGNEIGQERRLSAQECLLQALHDIGYQNQENESSHEHIMVPSHEKNSLRSPRRRLRNFQCRSHPIYLRHSARQRARAPSSTWRLLIGSVVMGRCEDRCLAGWSAQKAFAKSRTTTMMGLHRTACALLCYLVAWNGPSVTEAFVTRRNENRVTLPQNPSSFARQRSAISTELRVAQGYSLYEACHTLGLDPSLIRDMPAIKKAYKKLALKVRSLFTMGSSAIPFSLGFLLSITPTQTNMRLPTSNNNTLIAWRKSTARMRC